MIGKFYFKKALSFIAVYFLMQQVHSQQRLIYVAPNGSDKSNGSISMPVASVGEAIRRIRSASEKVVVIELRKGVYSLDTTIVLNASTLAGHKLTIRNYNSEAVTISGAKPVSLHWKKYTNRIYVADLDKGMTIDRLFMNGRPLHMARYPNYSESARVFNGTASDALDAARVARWKHPAGAYVHALHQGEWGGFHYQVIGTDSNGAAILEGGWQNNRPAPMHNEFRFVENVFEELDAPGEWYYDAAAGKMYLIPPASFEHAQFSYSNLNDLIAIRGSSAEPVVHVQIQGIRFTGTNRTFMLTKEPLLRTDWTIYRGGAILLDGTENVHVSDCEFADLGGNAVFVSNYNRQVHIEHNHIHDIGGNGIAFIGNPAAVRSATFQYNELIPYEQMDMQRGPKSNEYPQQCFANDNLVHSIGQVEKQVAGIVIDMASNISVTHNSIYNVPRSGINIGDGCWGGHLLAYNDVFNTVLETGDHGAFNSWGRDRFWLPNGQRVDSMVGLHPDLPFLDVVDPITIRNNRFQCAHGWDIDLDDGSSNYRIYNNLCLEGGLKLREGYGRVVSNNILVNNSFHPHVWFKNSGDVFTHNIVSADYAPIGIEQWGRQVDSNFFLQKVSLDAAQVNGTDAHSAFGDPGFIKPLANDYSVSENSPALAMGFRPFSMNEFGVIAPRLKALAKKPAAQGIKIYTLKEKGQRSDFLGAVIKNIEGLGERSAAGLPDEDGVLVLSVGQESLAAESGLKERDVIRKINGKEVKDMIELVAAVQVVNWQGQAEATVIRQQSEKKITLRLK